uniref:Uncharacterized protein n=1 Tax=Panagrellus redivivus TaxID=6233 RepID=A0A7E4VMK1_PANRE
MSTLESQTRINGASISDSQDLLTRIQIRSRYLILQRLQMLPMFHRVCTCEPFLVLPNPHNCTRKDHLDTSR